MKPIHDTKHDTKAPAPASERLVKLKDDLAKTTKSLEQRNDALELHLVQSGWTTHHTASKR